MSLKIALLISLVTAIQAGFIPTNQIYHSFPNKEHLAPAAVTSVGKTKEYDTWPQYKYSYGVKDPSTGDSKSQSEQRDGDVVRGEYTLVDADGIVKYTADDQDGFNAEVERVPLRKTFSHLSANVVETKYLITPNIQATALPLAQLSTPHPILPVINSVASVSKYTSRYSSYDAPIYLRAALGHNN